MVFVADDLGAWLVGLLADIGRKKLTTSLFGTEQERALQLAATAAVQRTAEELHPDDGERTEQLAMVVSQVFGEPVPGDLLAENSTVLEALQAGIARQLAVLDDVSMTGTGQSSADALGVSVTVVTRKLTGHLVREIAARGSHGGPLAPLANQLNHDATHLQGQRIEERVRDLTDDRADAQLETALAQLSSSSEEERLNGITMLEILVSRLKTAGDRPACQLVLSRLAMFVREHSHYPRRDNRPLPDVVAALGVISRGLKQQDPAHRIDLSNANLSGALLQGINLTGADLHQADLTYADLTGANLAYAILTKAILGRANLKDANLNGANLTEANLIEGNLRGAILTNATLSHARLINADLAGADLAGAVLDNADSSRANFAAAILVGAHLIYAYLTHANLVGANLTDADLFHAKLCEADLHRGRLTGTNLAEADLTNAFLNDADLTGADVTGADLTDAILTGAIWPKRLAPDGWSSGVRGRLYPE